MSDPITLGMDAVIIIIMYACMHVCMYICMYMYAFSYACTYCVCMQSTICMYVCMCDHSRRTMAYHRFGTILCSQRWEPSLKFVLLRMIIRVFIIVHT